ncbi:MAG: transcription elongation factor Spt5 [archaeon]
MAEEKQEKKEDVSDEVEKWLNEDTELEAKGELPETKLPKKKEEPESVEKESVVTAAPSAGTAAPPDLSKTKREPTVTVLGPEKKEEPEPVAEGPMPETRIFALRTTANREDQVMTFVSSNAERKGIEIFSVIRPHGMRGYIFIEAPNRTDAEQAAYGIPYARGILPNEIEYKEIEHMLEQVKKDVNIQKGDIAEIISGPFKREKAKITRVDKIKEEVVVELLEAAVPIPITVKLDSVKVIRRDSDEEN